MSHLQTTVSDGLLVSNQLVAADPLLNIHEGAFIGPTLEESAE